jgi:hypothetical protein
MKRRASGGRQQEALFANERAEPVRAEGTRELVRALADLLLEALGHGTREEAINESEDHD